MLSFRCKGGEEVTLEDVARAAGQSGGSVEALYISGDAIDTLQPLAGALRSVRQGLAIVGSAVATTAPLAGLRIAGGLALRGNVRLADVDLMANVTAVQGNVQVVDNGGSVAMGGLEGLTNVGGDLTLAGCALGGPAGSLAGLASVGGDLRVSGCEVSGGVLRRLERVGGRLEIDSNTASQTAGEFNLFGSLSGVCAESGDEGSCSLEIRNNTGYVSVDGYGKLGGFNGSLSILGNDGLRAIKGFGALQFLAPRRPTDENFEERLRRVLACTIAFNPDLISVEGFDALESLAGDLNIVENPQLRRIIMTKVRFVDGETRIQSNSPVLPNFRSDDPLPFRQPNFECIYTHTNVPTWRPASDSDPAFITDLANYMCQRNPVPMLLGVAVGVLTMAASVLVALYVASRRRQGPKERLGERLAVHVVAIGDVLSDAFFATSCFIIWQLDDAPFYLLIGGLVVAVLALSQLYLIVSTYLSLNRKRHLAGAAGACNLGKGDWCLLFSGLFLLDASVVEYLPWEQIPLQEEAVGSTEGFSDGLAKISRIAAFVGNVPQILLQTGFLLAIDGELRWAIPVVVSTVMTAANLTIKGIIPLLAKRFAAVPAVEDGNQEL